MRVDKMFGAEAELSSDEFKNILELFLLLRVIKVQQVKADAKKYLGIEICEFQYPWDQSGIRTKLEPEKRDGYQISDNEYPISE